ncbi:SanA/YdcF family protein [Pedobacter jamesrossensis]|uniref:Vancomycin high temperature exclusion protein n=1 Tax=Pedobacter jamesrossensis TaxID=1908238 RepID=A0ABV8NIS2_9SPHI
MKSKIIKGILIFGLFGLAVIFSTNLRVKSLTEKSIYNNVEDVPKTNIAIIFGAGINGDKPSKYLKDRLDAGIKLYKANKVQKLLLSGDNGDDEHDELTVMKVYCYQNGVDTSKIYLDYAGFDSYSTMYRAKEIFKVDTAILVSQKYHLNRAVYIGNNLGIKSFGYVANNGSYQGYKYVGFREYLAITKSVFDVLRKRKPHFLGESVDISGQSNYTKK